MLEYKIRGILDGDFLVVSKVALANMNRLFIHLSRYNMKLPDNIKTTPHGDIHLKYTSGKFLVIFYCDSDGLVYCQGIFNIYEDDLDFMIKDIQKDWGKIGLIKEKLSV